MKKLHRILIIFATVILALAMSVFSAACDINQLFGGKDNSENSTTTPDDSKDNDNKDNGNKDNENKDNENKDDENKDNENKDDENKNDGELVKGDKDEISTSKFSIHFIELGNGNCGDSILIKCGDTEVLIDAGSTQSSIKVLKPYIDQYCTDGKLEYVIATHTDTDHIAAFFGNSTGGVYNGILYSYEIGTIIRFDNVYKSTSNYTKFCNAVDYAKSKGTEVYTASQCYDEKDGAKRQYYLDEEKTVSINILYNYYYYNTSSDENNHSVVTLLTEDYDGGKRNYLFTGDLETDGESRMVDYYNSVPAGYDTEYNVLPEVDLYKAGHHGSKTSSTEKLLEVIKPKYVAVCCSAGAPQYTPVNTEMFPTQTMINNVAKYTDKIYVTTICTNVNERDESGNFITRNYDKSAPMNGNLVFYSTGSDLKLYCSNNDTILKETEWFQENRTWPSYGV